MVPTLKGVGGDVVRVYAYEDTKDLGKTRTELQPTSHPHGPLWGIEFSLASASKPNQSAPKRAKLSVVDSSLQAKGEQSTHPSHRVSVCLCLTPCSPPPPPQRMHYFGQATFLNICHLCCHGCALQLCRWRRANNFFRPPSGRLPIPLYVPIAVRVGPPMGTPRPPSSTRGCSRGKHGRKRKKKQQEKPLLHRRPQQKKQELQQHWWQQRRAWPWQRCKCTSAPRRAETAWPSRPGSTPALGWSGRPRLPSVVSEPWGGLKNLGSSPPPFPMALLEQPIRENVVGVCSFLGVTPKCATGW